MRQRNSRLAGIIVAAAVVAALLPAGAGAQDPQRVEVTSGGDRIVVDGDQVRIESGGTVLTGDWRSAGTVYVTEDTDRILVELGAVSVEDRIQLNLAGDILFDFDSTAIRPDAAAQLAKVAHVIRNRAVGEVHVIGHTDSIGDDAYNQKLSRERAVAVMRWLNASEGIPTAVMVGSGMGSRRPIAHNTHPDGSDDPAGRARNRRVEIQMATREGVVVGPGVVIGPGAVQVTDQGVSVGGGAVQVDAGGVRVGDISVGPGGVRVESGGVTVESDASGQTTRVDLGSWRTVGEASPSACPTGESCNFTCIEGDCRMSCQPGATCNFACPGGDCRMGCESGATCNFACAGGDCSMDCAAGAVCAFTCSGGDCLFDCHQAADCRLVTCTGGECVCRGAGC